MKRQKQLLDRRLAGDLFILLKETDRRECYGCAVCVIDTRARVLKKDDIESWRQAINLHTALPMETQVIGHFKHHAAMVSAVQDAQTAALKLWRRTPKKEYVHEERTPVKFGGYIVAVGGVDSRLTQDVVAVVCTAMLVYRDVHSEDMPYEIMADYERFTQTVEETLKGLDSDFLSGYGLSFGNDGKHHFGRGQAYHWPQIAWEFVVDMGFQTGIAFRRLRSAALEHQEKTTVS